MKKKKKNKKRSKKKRVAAADLDDPFGLAVLQNNGGAYNLNEENLARLEGRNMRAPGY